MEDYEDFAAEHGDYLAETEAEESVIDNDGVETRDSDNDDGVTL